MKDLITAALVSLTALLTLAPLFSALSENTSTLPKGRSSVSLTYFSNSLSREFDNSGGDRELGYFLNRVDITGLTNAKLLEQTGPLPFDLLSLAETELNCRVDLYGYVFSWQYGVTDRFTVGVGLPYFAEARSRVDFGLNMVFTPDAQNADLDRAILAAISPQELAQTFLHRDLGYDRIEDWNGTPGIGDLVVGGKYRFLEGGSFKAAVSSLVSIPTGKSDDERNLLDVPYGSGSYLAGLSLIGEWVPVDWVSMAASAGYVIDFPHHRGVYVLDPKDKVFYESEFPTLHRHGDFDRGDYYTLEGEVSFLPAPGVRPFVGYRYMASESDRIDGDLMPKTARNSQKLIVGISASTVESYLEEKAALPIIFSVRYEPVQSGRNINKDALVFADLQIIF